MKSRFVLFGSVIVALLLVQTFCQVSQLAAPSASGLDQTRLANNRQPPTVYAGTTSSAPALEMVTSTVDIVTARSPNTCITREANLSDLVNNDMSQLKLLDHKGMSVPDDLALSHWQTIVMNLADMDLPAACAALKASGFPYQIIDFTDQASGVRSIVLREISPPELGWGFYLFNPHPRRDLVIEAPHPLVDKLTEREALEVYVRTGAVALLIAGTRRCASSHDKPVQPVECNPKTDYGDSDVAHLERSPFQSTHQILLPCDGSRVAIQLHGHDRTSCPDVFISNTLESPDALSNRLISSVKQSCTNASVSQPGENQSCSLIGQDNIQGAFLRACTEPGERFFHIEQSLPFRQNSTCLSDALNLVFPEIEK